MRVICGDLETVTGRGHGDGAWSSAPIHVVTAFAQHSFVCHTMNHVSVYNIVSKNMILML